MECLGIVLGLVEAVVEAVETARGADIGEPLLDLHHGQLQLEDGDVSFVEMGGLIGNHHAAGEHHATLDEYNNAQQGCQKEKTFSQRDFS